MLGANVTVRGPDGKDVTLLLCVSPDQPSLYQRLYLYANCDVGMGGRVGQHHFGVAARAAAEAGSGGAAVQLDARGYPVGRGLLWGFLRNDGNCGEPVGQAT